MAGGTPHPLVSLKPQFKSLCQVCDLGRASPHHRALPGQMEGSKWCYGDGRGPGDRACVKQARRCS